MRRVVGLTIVLLSLAGCGDAGPEPADRTRGGAGSAAESAEQATDRVRAAVETMEQTSFAFRNTSDDGASVIDGVVHRPSESTTMKMAITMEDAGTSVTQFVRIGDRGWGRIDLIMAPVDGVPASTEGVTQWKVLPPEMLAQEPFRQVAGGAFLVSTDLFTGVTGLHQTAPQTYAGTIDIAAHPLVGLLDESFVATLGERARAVPLTVTLDLTGRITTLVMDVPDHRLETRFTDFDAVTAPVPPATVGP
ncbi:hypothetical protein DFJ67_0255 [Asanoa ferruginea]|uniref:Lipoprotein LprG n=1 Tax=Asanoa ferruginea TaxID=53367 RepID=A0A3D9ZA99_9ACTN|nr:hypothetical protein [Asanoa ferruginea]REF94338.1 hypothetical protein DFJ67_0255 [Asanoa ferruginea]GIF52296.1 hypothetical protein Afe04nite_68350 [Asanoa ferruginea]